MESHTAPPPHTSSARQANRAGGKSLFPKVWLYLYISALKVLLSEEAWKYYQMLPRNLLTEEEKSHLKQIYNRFGDGQPAKTKKRSAARRCGKDTKLESGYVKIANTRPVSRVSGGGIGIEGSGGGKDGAVQDVEESAQITSPGSSIWYQILVFMMFGIVFHLVIERIKGYIKEAN
ncbi:MAG: hypothetical protein Q9170_002263 [Blastenia crenularia]